MAVYADTSQEGTPPGKHWNRVVPVAIEESMAVTLLDVLKSHQGGDFNEGTNDPILHLDFQYLHLTKG